MRHTQKVLTRLCRLSAGGLRQKCRSFNQQNFKPSIADEANKRPTHFQSMREFFMHPLTWDRNNGYFNVVLALSIFGFCFFNSCAPCEQKRGGLEERTNRPQWNRWAILESSQTHPDCRRRLARNWSNGTEHSCRTRSGCSGSFAPRCTRIHLPWNQRCTGTRNWPDPYKYISRNVLISLRFIGSAD